MDARSLRLMIIRPPQIEESLQEPPQNPKRQRLGGEAKPITIRDDTIEEHLIRTGEAVLQINARKFIHKSLFFEKLFKGNLKEASESEVTICLLECEVHPFMGMVYFINNNYLENHDPIYLAKLLVLGDKFSVKTCIDYCSERLVNNLTFESALKCLDISPGDFTHQISEETRKYLVQYFIGLTNDKEAALDLPIGAIEVIFESDDLVVDSEDDVYDFIQRWSKKHFPDSDERQIVLTQRLGSVIRFPQMSTEKLHVIEREAIFPKSYIKDVLYDCMAYKSEDTYKHFFLSSPDLGPRFVRRPYRAKPINVTSFNEPFVQSVAHWDLKKTEIADLNDLGTITSQPFPLGSDSYCLIARRNVRKNGIFFGLTIKRLTRKGEDVLILFKFSVRKKGKIDFEKRSNGKVQKGEQEDGVYSLFGVEWETFLDDTSACSDYFINGVMHLKADLVIGD